MKHYIETKNHKIYEVEEIYLYNFEDTSLSGSFTLEYDPSMGYSLDINPIMRIEDLLDEMRQVADYKFKTIKNRYINLADVEYIWRED